MELKMIPPRYRLRVKQRLAILKYVQEHSLQRASQRFGLRRGTIREWRDRWRAEGYAGLIPRYASRRRGRVPPEVIELVRHARFDLEYGSGKTRIWLDRIHRVRLARMTIQRIFRDLVLVSINTQTYNMDVAMPSNWRGQCPERARTTSLFHSQNALSS
jgi:transposase